MNRTMLDAALARSRRRDGGGYVLITALAAMLLCTVLVAALLGLTNDTNAIEESGRVREREIRAAEGAIETAINQIRNAQNFAAPIPWQPGQSMNVTDDRIGGCEDLLDEPLDPNNPPTDPSLQRAPLLEIDSVKVRVQCTDQGGFPQRRPLTAGEPDQWIPADNGGPSLRLVGETGYTRTWVDKTALPWASALPAGQYDASTVANAKASLVHTGKAPLRVVGGLEARHRVLALRDPKTATVAGPGADEDLQPYGEAVEVTGYAQQGGPGLFLNATGGSTGCGVASPDNVWGVQATMVTASSDIDPAADGLVCDDAALAAGTGLGLAPGSGDWTHKQTVDTRTSQRQADAFPGLGLPTNCSALRVNQVVNLSAYTIFDRDDTKILNQWFTLDNDNDCPNTTFYFGPGDYWFDVWDPDNPNPDLRSTLRFNDYSSDWVFGSAAGMGWDPSTGRPNKADFPKVCNQDANGANIVLSSRTGLWHAAGRVSICGPRTARTDVGPEPAPNTPSWTAYHQAPAGAPVHDTAIWQRTSTAIGDRLHASSPNSASGWTPSNGFAIATRAQDGNNVRTQVVVPPLFSFSNPFPWFRAACWTFGNCGEVQRSFTATNFVNVGVNPGAEAITNASIDLTANAAFANGSGARIRFEVDLNNGNAAGADCVVEEAKLPTNFVTKSYTLRAGSSGPCAGVLTDRSQLRGANVRVIVTMNNPALWFNNPGFMSFEIDSLQLRTSWKPAIPNEANNITSPSTSGLIPFENPERARINDVQAGGPANLYATVTKSCGTTFFGLFCTGTAQYYESRLDTKFKDDALLDGFLPVTSASMDIDMRSNNALGSGYGPTNGDKRLVVTLTTPSGATCTVDRTLAQMQAALPTNGVDGRVTLELVGGTGPCTGFRTGDLVDATVSILLRASNSAVLASNGNFGWWVNAISLNATANGYDKPETPFRVRWSPYKAGSNFAGDPTELSTPGEPGDALFNVVGSTSITTNEVEVDFDGRGRPVGQPIFVGGKNRPGLVAASLGSRTVDGGWPCSPADPTCTDPWTDASSHRLPDPVSSNGTTRPPVRRVWLTACIVDNTAADVNAHTMYRRVQAEIDIRDDATSGGAIDIGREVQVRRWKILGGSTPIASKAAASTADCTADNVW